LACNVVIWEVVNPAAVNASTSISAAVFEESITSPESAIAVADSTKAV
jgi:hypothetical protein